MLEYFPDPHPDEILYSVWARLCDDVRYQSKQDVLRELFGSKHYRGGVDLPRHLGSFVDHLPFGHTYTVDWFIERHTLLPFYRPFLPPERIKRVRELMINDGDDNPITSTLGVVRRETRSPLRLRYCPSCVEHDRELFGECYWHRLHQVLGVEVCPIHMTFLENSPVLAKGPFAVRECISAERAIQATPSRVAVSSSFYKELMDIAADALCLLTTSCDRSGHDFLRRQYQALLSQRGYIARDGRIRLCEFLVSFADYYPPELLHLLHSEFTHMRYPRRSWPARALDSRQSQHPVHHLLVLHFLGCKAETFFQQDLQPLKPFGDGPWPCLNPASEHYQQRTIISYELKRGRDRLVGRFACECGFTYTRPGPDHSPEDAFRRERILSFGTVWEMKLREYWSDLTVSRDEISSRLGIPQSTLNSLIVKLQLPRPRNPSWKQRSKVLQRYSAETISWHREQWLILVREFPGESRTFLLRKRRKLYRWLDLHDNAWLIAHSPPRKKRQSALSRRVKLQALGKAIEDKENCDIRTAERVSSVARSLKMPSDTPKKVTFQAILKEVPELIGVRSRPKDYPRTRRVLKEVLETKEEYGLRKIEGTLQKYLEERICPGKWLFIKRSRLGSAILRSQIIQRVLAEAMTALSQFLYGDFILFLEHDEAILNEEVANARGLP
jgi:Tn7-like transposition protein D/TniQ protein